MRLDRMRCMIYACRVPSKVSQDRPRLRSRKPRGPGPFGRILLNLHTIMQDNRRRQHRAVAARLLLGNRGRVSPDPQQMRPVVRPVIAMLPECREKFAGKGCVVAKSCVH